MRAILDEGVRARLEGDRAQFDINVHYAELIGRMFEGIYGEKSGTFLVSSYYDWSDADLVVKLRADSLEASGRALRASSATRDQAFADYEGALEAYEEIGDESGRSTVLGGLGYVAYFREGSGAFDFNTQALEARRSIDDRLQIGNALNTIALVYRTKLGEPDSVLVFYERALRIRQHIGDFNGIGRTLFATAVLLELELNRIAESVDYYRRASEAHMRAGNTRRAAVTLTQEGAVLSDIGKPSQALKKLTRARDLYFSLEDLDGVAEATTNMGRAHRLMGDFEAAMDAYQKVLPQARAAGNKLLEGIILNNIAALFVWAERPERVAAFAE